MNMYNVMIADDEQLTRTYLANNITALCPFFQVTGVAADGIEAMDLCNIQRFDLIITDIQMPEMDGLSLCKHIYESGMDTKLVILSGYNEFEYARTAIKYQVSEYILKPINDENLKEILLTVKEELDKKQKLQEKEYYTVKTDTHLLEDFLTAAIEENQGKVYEIYGYLEERGIGNRIKYSCMVLFCVDELNLVLLHSNGFDVVSRNLMLYKQCQDYGCEKGIPVIYDNYSSVQMLFEASDKEELYRQREYHCNEIRKRAKKSGLPKLLALSSDFYEDIFEAAVSGITVHDGIALALRMKKNLYLYEDWCTEKEFLTRLADISEELYRDYLKADSSRMKEHMQQFYQCLPGEENAEKILLGGSYLIHFICSRANVKTHYRQAAYETLIQGVNERISAWNLTGGEMAELLIRMMEGMIPKGKAIRISESNQLAEQAKQYMYAHFAEPISLVSLAEILGVNSCYLSDLIHRHLGESYSKYLLRIRMERAAQLLKTHPEEKVYIVAQKTGFVSAKHFISVFKKYYGVTPSVFADHT